MVRAIPVYYINGLWGYAQRSVRRIERIGRGEQSQFEAQTTVRRVIHNNVDGVGDRRRVDRQITIEEKQLAGYDP